MHMNEPPPTQPDAGVEPAPGAHREQGVRWALTKVPQIIALFWVSKIAITAMGEATSDYMNAALGPAIAVPIMLIGLYVALKLQSKRERYVAWNYWLVVVAIGVFGTSAADALHVGLGIAYPVSTAFYAAVLACVFSAWYRSEGTLSIHSIYTPRRERYYWATVFATFALGTAAGDMTATAMHLGYFTSGLLFTGLILIPLIAWRIGLNPIVAFWFAYILTRPLGASFADWLANPHRLSGLALGTGPVTLGLAIIVAGFIAYLARTRVDVKREPAHAAALGMLVPDSAATI
jgi:uncharacterized membrane-anchored protein